MVLKAAQDSSILSNHWYNVIPDLSEELPPPILPGGQIAGSEVLEKYSLRNW